MKTKIVVAAILLLLDAERLPAPIAEENSPSPTSSPSLDSGLANQKSPEASGSNSFARFEGVWRASASKKSKSGNTMNVMQTLIVRNASAEYVAEVTGILAPGQKWNDIAEPHNSTTPLYMKRTKRSESIQAEGSNLRIAWEGEKIVAWSPNTIPISAFKNVAAKPGTVLLILNGDRLIDTNGTQSQTYTRLR
jgi:hypothetical protein